MTAQLTPPRVPPYQDGILHDLMENLCEVFWSSDPAIHRMLYVSPAFERIWGRSRASLYASPRSFIEAVHEADRDGLRAALEDQKLGKVFEHEYRVVRPDGAVRWIWDRGHPVRDSAQGPVTHYVGVATDITERKHSEKSLRLFRELVDRASDTVAIINRATLRIVDINQKGCDASGYSRDELLRMSVFDLDPQLTPELVAQRDPQLQDLGSLVYQAEFRRKDGTMHPVEVSISRVELEQVYMVATVRDVSMQRRMERNMQATIYALASAVEKRDPYTAGHQHRVARLAVAIGRILKLPEDRLHGLSLGATIHDIGKLSLPAEILSKPGRITAIERELIKSHAAIGAEILDGVELPWPIKEMIWQHHERLDGSGYPRGLTGDAILLEARIIAVADTVEAMASHRPYRPARSVADAMAEIQRCRGTLFDPDVVDACLQLFLEQGFDLGEEPPGPVAREGPQGRTRALNGEPVLQFALGLL